jgi:peptidoglycan/xylan/chitin deacetylase (PgdA/CDA1 family)
MHDSGQRGEGAHVRAASRARRGAWRPRARRRGALLAGLALPLVAILVLALAGAGPGTRRRAARPSLSVSGVPAAHAPQQRSGPVSDGHAAQRVLGYTSYVQLAGHRRREVALTFDDGPGRYTPAILRVLRATHTPATFFAIGRWARAYPQLIATEARAGFDVGDHTQTHALLAVLPAPVQAEEIGEASEAIRHAGAAHPRLFRPPYGAFDRATLQILRARRMLMVLWSVDTKDYARPGSARIIYAAVSGGQPGAIILMHDGGGDRSQTVAALPRIILRLRQRGFRLVTVSKLLADDPPARGQPPPRPLAGYG